MTTYNFIVENIKCSGCKNTITNALMDISGVTEVLNIDRETQTITLTGSEELEESKVYVTLQKLGYPKMGENNWMEKSKSVVSCAIGKLP